MGFDGMQGEKMRYETPNVKVCNFSDESNSKMQQLYIGMCAHLQYWPILNQPFLYLTTTKAASVQRADTTGTHTTG